MTTDTGIPDLADVPNATLADLLDAEVRALVQDHPEALAVVEEVLERLRRCDALSVRTHN
jgi:hypothetical protein